VPVALVTGANRGLGFETSRQLGRLGYSILLAGRDEAEARQAAVRLRGEGLDVTPLQLDVTDDASAARLGQLGQVDALVNNAGIVPESPTGATADAELTSVLEVPADLVRRGFETNTLGAYRVCQAIVPTMLRQGRGRIVNVSTGMAQLADMNGRYPGYRLSKTALNALTRILADELAGRNILVNSVCPGWVRTDMGGPNARLSVEEGVETIVWAATLPDGGPSGGFFRYRKPIAWLAQTARAARKVEISPATVCSTASDAKGSPGCCSE
jgi:NAD(P)-dependent dehydrogenase (short-subunit alcohol dehydrogenase family)